MKDIMGMLKQAKELQEKVGALQEQIAEMEIAGSAGGGLVTVTVDGKGVLKAVKIDPSLAREDEVEVLEDLIVAAAADARAKADRAAEAKMAELTSGLSLPAGLKLPF
ncbi:YbaB/EbfC family nucleoid-associated protein [Propylenella binzhouense]|uniref:Nucleoid-associated protein E4O86_16085 n=1 Tax=Propylenella binzhouense TaxID=2555902 RepID=A0A964T642_9HYPH|nr:YbaB/EbfC family nucleoid-associated protein [Propylenella binzhouense]MYZ49231.1 YbaB/EbfC family nucleoid-associated protein [Propylenella binzhouense]